MKFEALIKNVLVDQNYVTKEDMEKAEKSAAEHRGSYIDYLLTEGLVSKQIIGQAIAEYFHVPYTDLGSHMPDKSQISLVPEDIAVKWRVVLVKEEKSQVTIATDAPQVAGLAEALEPIFSGKKAKITFSLSQDIDDALAYYRQQLETRFAKIIKAKGKVAPEIVDQIIDDAVQLHASDIHLEPTSKGMLVRFRIDGVLQDAGTIPFEYADNVVNRIKIQAKLRIDEHFTAQDGAVRHVGKAGDGTDLRVSIVPTLSGEKIAIRILSSYVTDLTMSSIGLPDELQKVLEESSKKSFGMILVTGPTGSGKTTSLYSLIKLLNTKQINITTIEDPVEYKIDGTNQIQVNPAANLTFAKGLRSIARQDPNIIFVGEIRDLETADIAVNAALTGHLLLSTFHANNAPTAIPRFIDMGVEPFLVSSTIELIISQRLVRKICDSCKVSYAMTKDMATKVGPEAATLLSGQKLLYRGKGCNVCGGTGYKGRLGVFEYIKGSPELQDLISKNPSTKEVKDLVVKQGYKPMFYDGIEKVKAGITSIDELLRVVSFNK